MLLGITTIGTAWCGYQSVQWSGASSDHAQAASDKHVEAARLFGLATQKVAYDSTTTAQYAAAVATGNTQLQNFYRSSLVRKGFLPTLDRWEAQIKAGQTPVPLADDPEYLDSQLADYRKVSNAAEEDTQLGIEAGATASAYVSVTILLAAALFFSGVVSSFSYRPARALLLAAALATLGFRRLADGESAGAAVLVLARVEKRHSAAAAAPPTKGTRRWPARCLAAT